MNDSFSPHHCESLVFDPLGRSTVTAGSDSDFQTSVLVSAHFINQAKQNIFYSGLAEWIIEDFFTAFVDRRWV